MKDLKEDNPKHTLRERTHDTQQGREQIHTIREKTHDTRQGREPTIHNKGENQNKL